MQFKLFGGGSWSSDDALAHQLIHVLPCSIATTSPVLPCCRFRLIGTVASVGNWKIRALVSSAFLSHTQISQIIVYLIMHRPHVEADLHACPLFFRFTRWPVDRCTAHFIEALWGLSIGALHFDASLLRLNLASPRMNFGGLVGQLQPLTDAPWSVKPPRLGSVVHRLLTRGGQNTKKRIRFKTSRTKLVKIRNLAKSAQRLG